MAPSRADTQSPALASGELALPAARAFGDAGLHERLGSPHAVGAAAHRDTAGPPTARCDPPTQTSGSEHPLSGCATVHWSDDVSRPKIPVGGVFENSITVRLATGTLRLFLCETGLSETNGPHEPD